MPHFSRKIYYVKFNHAYSPLFHHTNNHMPSKIVTQSEYQLFPLYTKKVLQEKHKGRTSQVFLKAQKQLFLSYTMN
jgi:hypothetical protein